MAQIRKLKTSDELEEILKLDFKLLEFEATVDPGLKIPNNKIRKYERDFFEQKFNEIKDGKVIFFIAEEKNKIVGYSFGWIQKNDLNHKINTEGYICNVYVMDEYRKQKIGKLLTDEIIKWFKSKGIKRAVIDITEKNEVGMNFWGKYGFKLHPFRRMSIEI